LALAEATNYFIFFNAWAAAYPCIFLPNAAICYHDPWKEGLKTRGNVNFECALTVPLYQEMILLMKGFCERESNGYQWLYGLDCEIDLLFSPGGTW
jgi:hypothetical protein